MFKKAFLPLSPGKSSSLALPLEVIWQTAPGISTLSDLVIVKPNTSC